MGAIDRPGALGEPSVDVASPEIRRVAGQPEGDLNVVDVLLEHPQ